MQNRASCVSKNSENAGAGQNRWCWTNPLAPDERKGVNQVSRFAEVIVNISHPDVDRTFQYRIPESLQDKIAPGSPVRVPFGSREVTGIVIAVTDHQEVENNRLKLVSGIVENGVPIEGQLIRLAAWMRETYGCTMNQALRTVLPSRRRVKSRAKIEQVELPEDRDVPPALNPEQQAAADGIWKEIHRENPRTCLLFGVTGSGKTEVYMNLIARTIAEGRQAILLIPEISLTYQNVRRFYRRFGNRVATINSRLSAGEKYESFRRAREGEADLMIGPRSALFAPFPNLGLILVDEEHDSAYHSETSPRYRASETAQARGRIAGAGVVLGSATPDIVDFYAAMDRKMAIFPIRSRAVPGSTLPQVDVVDLREEFRAKNMSIFSRLLTEEMTDTLARGEQIILFLNRRGYSGFVSCRSCGYVIKCPHCDVALTEHVGRRLVCHYCGYEMPEPSVCPKCGSSHIAGFGIGTERVEAITKKMFPRARVLRMDLGTTGGKNGHTRILKKFASGGADILIGTQMIVKGHDFPNVTLVGMISADLSLYSSDFRSSERTFQLITQAAGRAGRAGKPGRVVIQTYSPEHYAIQTAAAQQYVSFYKQETEYRKMLGYPPFGAMLSILVSDAGEEKAQACAEKLARGIRESFSSLEPVVLGPSDAGIAKVQDIYRKQIYVKHPDEAVLRRIRDYVNETAFCPVQADLL